MSPRPQATARLRRVMALVPYLAARGEASIEELAEAFGVSEETIEDDLAILPFCGVPPYTPDRLIDVTIIDRTVSVRFAEYFARPLRLTPAEGFALLATGRALMQVPGSEPGGPLATALEKLEAGLGAGAVVDVDIGSHPDFVDRVKRAADDHERIEIDYYSFGRDEMTTRAIDPYSLVSLRGEWYLAAHCHRADDDRLFRVDRIRDVRATGEHFEPHPPDAAPTDVFSPRADDTRVVLDLPPEAGWVTEEYPYEDVEERRGRLRITLAVSAEAWLARLLLRVGPEAQVVEPEEWHDLAGRTARRILARYATGRSAGASATSP